MRSAACSSASASRQLRRSPIGGTRYARRRRPELPPSSATDTIAVIGSTPAGPPAVMPSGWSQAARPRSRIGRPVPPPARPLEGNPGCWLPAGRRGTLLRAVGLNRVQRAHAALSCRRGAACVASSRTAGCVIAEVPDSRPRRTTLTVSIRILRSNQTDMCLM